MRWLVETRINPALPSVHNGGSGITEREMNMDTSIDLSGKKVAVLVADGFEQEELTSPIEALNSAGAETEIVSPAEGKVKGWKHTDWGKKFEVDVPLSEADADDYDALVLPGGVMNPDKLRSDPAALEFVRAFFAAGKPVGAICHGPWTLIDAGVVEGRRMTSYESIQTDLKNAGADWVDEEVVVDNGLVTSRKPADLPAFNSKLIEEIGEGVHAGQSESTHLA
jgi:protease I